MGSHVNEPGTPQARNLVTAEAVLGGRQSIPGIWLRPVRTSPELKELSSTCPQLDGLFLRGGSESGAWIWAAAEDGEGLGTGSPLVASPPPRLFVWPHSPSMDREQAEDGLAGWLASPGRTLPGQPICAAPAAAALRCMATLTQAPYPAPTGPPLPPA